MAFVKSMLREELKNSLRMKKNYEKALKALPQGSLRVKNIHGSRYHYVALRKKGVFKDVYMGKLPGAKVREYNDAKKMRAKYRKLLMEVKKQIRFLKGAVRGKEAI